jgi:hypothetical protein
VQIALQGAQDALVWVHPHGVCVVPTTKHSVEAAVSRRHQSTLSKSCATTQDNDDNFRYSL